MWYQTQLVLSARPRGVHLITHEVEKEISASIHDVSVGWLQLFLQHTSASLSINENTDPDVRADLEMALNHVCPESLPYRHTCEGPDDMPAHVKTSLIGPSLLIPVQAGRLALGIWQGICLCEHRDRAASRSVLLTLQGE